jgi:hypothetical protein
VWQSNVAGSANAVAAGASVVARGFNPAGAAETGDVVVAESDVDSDPETPDVNLNNKGKTTVTFERKKTNGDSNGIFRREVLLPTAPSDCVEDAESLCLNGGRFKVRAEFETAQGGRGVAKAVELTDDTGYFWFFNEENVEVVVKALDACAFANRFWVFAGGLTDVEVTLVVDDTATGEAISYFNPLGAFAPIRDTAGFGACQQGALRASPELLAQMSDAYRAELEALAAADLDALGRTREQAGVAAGDCFPTPTRLCLNDARFAVEIDFRSSTTTKGPAFQQQITDDTGYFYFFDPDNVEVVVKVLNACAFAGRQWVFAAGLTDVEVELRVRLLETNRTITYSSPLGSAFAPITDTAGFIRCP